MAEPLEPPPVEFDFDLDAFLASIPPDFDVGIDGVLMDMQFVDDAKSEENSHQLSLELPVVVDPLLEPGAPGAKTQYPRLDAEFPEVAESATGSVGSGSPHGSDSTWAEELERFLMDDDDDPSYMDEGFFLHEFFDDAFVEGSADESVKKMESDGEHAAASLDPSTPLSFGSASPESNLEEAPHLESSNGLPEQRRGEEGGDPLEKKRRRQLRNRDSAMKSRERRKLYIGDLENKSKSLEMECWRLEYLLYSAAAENHALHKRLLRDVLWVLSQPNRSLPCSSWNSCCWVPCFG